MYKYLRIPSFGAVFIGEYFRDNNAIRHEYGHSVQLKKVGLVLYTTIIVLPSVFCFQLYKKEIISYEEYYNLPWERNASELGGANLP